jgi:hypothetical protein
VDVLRRLTGLLLGLVLAASLPLAAARAACVCDHGHEAPSSAQPHRCTTACTAATCPMHRPHTASAHATAPATGGDGGGVLRCDCAGQALALLGQASVPGILPGAASLDAPLFAGPPRAAVAEAPLALAAPPPAPPPRG